MGYGTINVGLTATKIVGVNADRQSLVITNLSSSGVVYIGPDDTIASGNAAALLSGYGSFSEDSGGTPVFKGDVYAITNSAAGTADVAYWERTI